MRIVGEINHPIYKMTILHMNNRYSLKIEDGRHEQTYKFREGEIDGISQIHELVSEPFLEKIKSIFKSMSLVRLLNENKTESLDEDFPTII